VIPTNGIRPHVYYQIVITYAYIAAGFDKIDGFDDIKKVVRQAIHDEKRHGILFLGPPACAKTLFLEAVIEEAGEGLYFDGTNTTNKILDVLNEERPNIVCIDDGENAQGNILYFLVTRINLRILFVNGP
jgi:hypothetical protein